MKRKADLEIPVTLSPGPQPVFISRLFFQAKDSLLKGSDPYLLLAWLFSLPAITPLIQPTITHSADGLLHLYRLVALSQTIRQGVWFPRWLPDLAYGYGFPLFIFYAPLSYYITFLLQILGLDVISAFNGSLMLALLTAAAGAYLFVKKLFGPKAGLLAGVAYVYAPFQLLNNLARGGLPAAWALALFPFAFWAFGRLIQESAQAARVLSPFLPLSALMLGLALLTHNTLNLLFMPFFLFYLGFELFVACNREIAINRPSLLKRLIFQVTLALILGAGLAAFFLLPAILEKDFAQVHRVITSPDFDFRFNFVSFDMLFSLPRPANTDLLNPDFSPALGPVQVALALVGLFNLLWYSVIAPIKEGRNKFWPPHFAIIFFTTFSLAVSIFMMLPTSLTVWEQAPLLAFVQFPHRLLGPAAFILAILAGAAVTTGSERLNFWLSSIGLASLFLSLVPLLYPRYDDRLPKNPSLVDMMAYEHRSGVIGTTSFGEYLPVWVKEIPGGSPLEAMYRAGSPVERLDRAYLPRGAEIEAAHYRVNQADLIVHSPEPYQAVFHTFYFPGWTALIDSQPAPIAPVTGRGLIGVSLPAGRHHLSLFFQETPLRRTANALSLISLATILTLLTISLWPDKRPTDPALRITHRGPLAPHYVLHFTPPFTRPQLLTLAGLAILLASLKLLYFDRFDNPLKGSFDSLAPGVSQQVNFGGQITLLGYDLEKQAVPPGQTLKLTAYWQARQPLSVNYSALTHLVDAAGHLYAGQDNLHPGALPARQWPAWGFVQDRHMVLIPPGTPPGDYFLAVGLYDPASWVRLPVVERTDPAWPDVTAIPVTVLKPARPPALAALGITWPVTADFGAELRLLGAAPERMELRRNDYLRIAIFWEARTKPSQDYQIGLRLLSTAGEPLLQQVNRPSYDRYPTPTWAADERVRDNHALWIPADLPDGPYQVQLQMVAENGQAIGKWVELGTLR